jgi:hypothetical protein
VSIHKNNFDKTLAEQNGRQAEAENAIVEKRAEIETANTEYEKAILTDDFNESDTMFKQLAKLKAELNQLETKKKLLAKAQSTEDPELKALAEKVKQENSKEMKRLYTEKLEHKARFAVIDEEYRKAIIENSIKVNGCINGIVNLASEIAEIADYIPSYSEAEKHKIRKMGTQVILTAERVSM